MGPHLLHGVLLAGITWDPFIRGLVIVVAGVVVLVGSVYLVLATDVGARVGFLLVAAGLTGLLSILAVLWMVLPSTAAIGRPTSWKPLQVVTGDFGSQVTVKGGQDFPATATGSVRPPNTGLKSKHWYWPIQSCRDTGWRQVDPAKITDPESAADRILAGGGATATPPQLLSPFSLTTDYVYVGAYEKGANASCVIAISRHKITLPFRSAHYAIIVAQPVIPVPATAGATAKPKADTTKPFTYVIIERNLGSVRQPQMLVAISMGIIFLLICNALHRRDKEIWARQAAERDQPAGAGPNQSTTREPVGANR